MKESEERIEVLKWVIGLVDVLKRSGRLLSFYGRVVELELQPFDICDR